VERGGKVIIPAFSLGRTQVVVHHLEHGMRAGRIPEVPVFVDSPLSADIAAVYQHYLDPGAADVLGGPGVRYVRSVEESKQLSTRREPCVLVAPGGMGEGRRIVGHLEENLDDPRCSVVLVSYQAPGTLGRRLLTPRARLRIRGRERNWWADVIELAGFSGHPDHAELVAYLAPLAGKCGKLRLVHGEPGAAEALAAALRDRGIADVAMPALGETVR
jgi:metallo-beta-lactamase family protein